MESELIKDLSEFNDSSQESTYLGYLKNNFIGYDFDPQKDRQCFQVLEDRFPHLNLLDELMTFHIWTLDTNITNNYRSRFFKWLRKSKSYR